MTQDHRLRLDGGNSKIVVRSNFALNRSNFKRFFTAYGKGLRSVKMDVDGVEDRTPQYCIVYIVGERLENA